MSDQRYLKYSAKQNNVNENIVAEDINALQDGIGTLQDETFIQSDDDFMGHSLFILENHPEVNSIIVDLMKTNEFINWGISTNIIYEPRIRSIMIAANQLTGIAYTTVFTNSTTKVMRKILLMASQYLPANTSISYEFSYDGSIFYPLTPDVATPLTLPDTDILGQFTLRITLNRSSVTDESPRVDAWSILYQDETYMFRFLDDGLDIDVISGWDGTIIP